ncbi:MAG: hypothetical protein H0W64_02335 [Gammaproteobacteria bacterium]|nr:hypothetical protein [Gammaproteobacteria bacterium]
MFLGIIQKFSALLLLAVTSFSYAGAGDDKIPCPSVSTIQQAANKIDTAGRNDTGYVANSSKPAFSTSHYAWVVSVYGLEVCFPNEANIIARGKEVIHQTTTINAPYATRFSDTVVFCTYGPADVMAVGFYKDSYALPNFTAMKFKR